MFVEHASLAGRGRRNALVTRPDAAIVERPASSVAILTAKERSRNGEKAFSQLMVIRVDTVLHLSRQLASLSAKVQAYEDVIKKLSNRFGVSDEQLVNIALAVVRNLMCLEEPIHV